MRFENSTDENRCDKEIAWITSCRECVFNVLCRLERIREKNLSNNKKTKWELLGILDLSQEKWQN